MTNTQETYTNLETSKLMNEACAVETGMVYRDWRSNGEIILCEKKDRWFDYPVHMHMGAQTHFICPAHSLATTMQWLDKYLDPNGWADIYAREKKHALLDAFIAGNYSMASKEVSEFIRGVIEK